MKLINSCHALSAAVLFFPVLVSADITLTASQSNSTHGVISTVEVTGSLDTSTLTIKDMAPLADTERGSGIGVGTYPNGGMNVGGIYTTPELAYVVSYYGINSADAQLLTTSATPVPASVVMASGGNAGFGIDNYFIYLPSNYVSGSALEITLTFVGMTLADLGFSTGTRTWTVANNQVTLSVSGLDVPPALAVSPSVPSSTRAGQPVQLSMTGGYSGGTVSYSAIAVPSGTASLVCSISGNVLTVTGGPGTCRIMASQPANSTYTASTSVFNVATTVAPAPVNPIPTLSAWMQFLMMSLLLASAGLIRRRPSDRE